ncbi:MAG: serine acetyltransferase [Bacteroidaceae bacterium]|nr:serine acetyltransferase [Bacteroidaceae bacterium]
MQDNDNSKVSADKAIAAVAARLSDYSFLEQKGVLHEYSESALIPSAKALEELVELCRSVFFPGFYGQTPSYPPLGGGLVDMVRRVHELLASQIAAGLYLDERPKTGESCKDVVRKEAECIATEVVEHLPEVKSMLETDVEAAYKGDPAATTYSEVVSCYPAIRAISIYRLAHVMHELGVPLIPRMLTEMAHSETGIDIHPAAQIGSHFTIDHGTGVVIGATTIIGNNVKLYQGVTLGAKSFPLGKNGVPIKGILRHPILKDNVIVYSNATILGRVTIGEGAVIGGNMWITDDVPAGAKLVLQCKTN